MADSLLAAVDREKVRKTLDSMEKSKAREFIDLVGRAYQPKPDPEDIEKLKSWLDKSPEIWPLVFEIAKITEANLIRSVIGQEVAQLALEKNAQCLRSDLDYEKASGLERALIDNIVICWLYLQWAESRLVLNMAGGKITPSAFEFWERRVHAAQARYLRACEALARIQRLAGKNPSLQVNIAAHGGQQVNIAGDVKK